MAIKSHARGNASKRDNKTQGAIIVMPGDFTRTYGPPPYDTPSDVPVMTRALIGMFAAGARKDLKSNLDMLEKYSEQGLLPPGWMAAWGVPTHPSYAHLDASAARSNRTISPRRRAVKRLNHHLAAADDRIAFVRTWRDTLKTRGHCDAANVLTRFLMAFDQSDELLTGTSHQVAMQDNIAETAYNWVYAYAKSHGMERDKLLDYTPPDAEHMHTALMLDRLHSPVHADKALRALPPPKRTSPKPKQSPKRTSTKSKLLPKSASNERRGHRESIYEINRAFIEEADKIAAAQAAKLAKPRDNKSVGRGNAKSADALPPKAVQALNDFAKAQGYKYVHAQLTAPRKVEALLLEHEGDNFGMRVVATTSGFGRWSVQPYSSGAARDNISDKPSQGVIHQREVPDTPETRAAFEAVVAFYKDSMKKVPSKSRSRPIPRVRPEGGFRLAGSNDPFVSYEQFAAESAARLEKQKAEQQEAKKREAEARKAAKRKPSKRKPATKPE